MSVIEIAEIDVIEGKSDEFESAVRTAQAIFEKADGYLGIQLLRVMERISTYRLMVTWETLEHHTVLFRGSAGFQEWRRIAGPYFQNAPRVDHCKQVL